MTILISDSIFISRSQVFITVVKIVLSQNLYSSQFEEVFLATVFKL